MLEKIKEYVNKPGNYGLLVTVVPIIFFVVCSILIYLGFILVTAP